MEKNQITSLLEKNDIISIKNLIQSMNVVDIADQMTDMEEASTLKLFRMMPKDTSADVFAYLPRDIRQHIISAITDTEIGTIIDELFLDDAVDFIEEMPANIVRRVLEIVPAEKRDMLNQFLQYPEDSAGSIMTVEFIGLKNNCSVADALRQIRTTGLDKETIYTCYVIDQNRMLLGAVSVRTLLLAHDDQIVESIMEKTVISATTTDNKEELTNDFRKYGLLAMPVVDHENRLVGIVTVDDVIELQEEAATEDFEIMAAMSPSEEPYLRTSVRKMTRNRVVWLLLLMLSATLTGSIIQHFEVALAALPALISFIPMLMDTGGNAGAQSSTLIIRGMALEEIKLSDIFRVLWRELRVALLCGSVLVIANCTRMLIMQHDFYMTLTVSLTLFATVILSKTVGCMLPMAAKKLRMDPAVMASPVITTIVDAGALVVYFMLAKLILGI